MFQCLRKIEGNNSIFVLHVSWIHCDYKYTNMDEGTVYTEHFRQCITLLQFIRTRTSELFKPYTVWKDSMLSLKSYLYAVQTYLHLLTLISTCKILLTPEQFHKMFSEWSFKNVYKSMLRCTVFLTLFYGRSQCNISQRWALCAQQTWVWDSTNSLLLSNVTSSCLFPHL